MPIRFKFKSSLNFDVLEIGDRASISLGELRAKVLRGKISVQGFDLIFSDEASGLEFKTDDSEISNGSNVIIKRVPAEVLPQSMSLVQVSKDHRIESNNHNLSKGPVDEFDFGSDLIATPDSFFPEFSLGFENDSITQNRKADAADSRKLHSPELLENSSVPPVQRGLNQSENDGSNLHGINGQIKLNKPPVDKHLLDKNITLPLELKCSLCESFFKEAVMIPCCQHSFCETCIHKVITEKKRCPKCFSNKCQIKDLLPNLSLRQAIEHFLESRMLEASYGDAIQKYVPDGESQIQTKDVVAPKPQKLDGWGGSYRGVQIEVQDLNAHSDFQGENQPTLPLVNPPDEAHSHANRKGGFPNLEGEVRNFSNGGRKGVRTCYRCGSPEHLIRDCPIANPNPVFQPGNGVFPGAMPGYARPFWNGSFPPFGPYANMYSNAVMYPFNASMAPAMPYAVPPYAAPVHGGLSGPVDSMQMDYMGSSHQPEHFGLQPCGSKRKYSDEDAGSEQISEHKNDSTSSPRRSHSHKLHEGEEASLSYSGDGSAKRSRRDIQKDEYAHAQPDCDLKYDRGTRPSTAVVEKKTPHGKSSYSGKDGSERQSVGSRHHVVEKSNEKRSHHDTDSRLSHQDVKKRDHSDGGYRKKHHHSSPEPRPEHSQRRVDYRERDSTYDEKRLREKWQDDRHRDDRRKGSHVSDDRHRGDHRSSNHRRDH